MRTPEDFAGGDAEAEYCSTCAGADGALKPWDVVLHANADYYARLQGVAPQAAIDMARALLTSMPAWKSRHS
jgi:hypothetical protein